ncbi:UNVERIFIED_CONTAM: hypothetical protein FKN15_054422 [Acipenser sinensis]
MTLEMESIKELIAWINRNTAAQIEQTARLERWTREMGWAPPKTQERETTGLERLIQEWEEANAAPLLPEPKGEEPLLPEPRGEEPPLPEPKGEEPPILEPRGEEPPLPEPRGEEPPLPEPRGEEPLLPEPRGEEPPLPEPRGEEPPLPEPRGEEPLLPEPRGEEPPLPEPRGKEAKSIPPPQPRPPPLGSSPVPHPLLLDTLPVFLDLPVLDLEPKSVQHWPQLGPWFPAPLSPSTQTSLGCCQTSLSLPLFAASLPLGDWTSLRRFPGEDLCPLLQTPVPRPTLRSPVKPLGSLVAGARSLPGWAGTWTDPPSSPPVEEGKKGHLWTRGETLQNLMFQQEKQSIVSSTEIRDDNAKSLDP